MNHAIRRLLRTPSFTFVVLITLSLSIGANTAVFAVLDGILLRPLPYPDPERLVAVWQTAPGVNIEDLVLSPSNYFTFKEENRTFQEFGLWTTGTASVTGLAEPEQVRTLLVTERTLPALGLQPAIGRGFSPQDDLPDSPQTVILTYAYWQRRFGGNPSAIGKRLAINSRPVEIIGVMPQSFSFLDRKPELILPLRLNRGQAVLGNFSYQGLARLKAGATLEQANADVNRMLPIVMASFPPPPSFTVKMFEEARIAGKVRPLEADVVGDIGTLLWVLMGTVGTVLLIACANVANLLLVRVEGRQQELAVRAALGAGWRRIARDLLSESLLLGLAGGAAGVALAYTALKILTSTGVSGLPRLESITININVLLFTLLLSLITGLVFGLVPALKYAGPHLAGNLRGSSRSVSHSRQRHLARNILVVVQIALALVLLVSSGLMIRTFAALKDVQPGFMRPEQVHTFRVSIPEADVQDRTRVVRMQQEILEKIVEIPGVLSGGFAGAIPMDGNTSNDPIWAEGQSYTEAQIPPIRRMKWVSPGFFGALGTPLIAGRDLEWVDVYQARRVAIVSENLAREIWKEPAAAVGKRIRETSNGAWREVIGVVADIYDDGVNHEAPATVYWPVYLKDFQDRPESVQRTVAYAVRSARSGSEAFVGALSKSVWEVNPNLPLASVRTLGEIYDASMARASFTLTILGIAGAMALLLGIIGVYGVMSYSISQRTREIGVRIALGAQQQDVRRMVVRHGLALAVAGGLCGVAAAAAVSQVMTSLLFNVAPLDPLTYAVVTIGLLAAAALASYIPARRATMIDPAEALRAD